MNAESKERSRSFEERLPVNDSQVQLKNAPVKRVTSIQARYGTPKRSEWPFPELSLEFALVFALPGCWTTVDLLTVDIDKEHGIITFPENALGLMFTQAEVVYETN